MNTPDLRTELITHIETELQSVLNALPKRPESLYEPFSYAMNAGGKRIRPILTALAAGMCGGEVKNALPAAMAVEILHNFTLVHDDIMDSAETRRGKPSVFAKWDENVAILSGDVMFAGAIQQLNVYGASEDYSKEEYAALNQIFLNSIVTVCEGQALDMEFVDRESVELSEYIEMISGKTAALLSSSLEMGAISAHASTEQRNSLAKLGMELGVAFQIQDDYLDATADPEKFGKRPGGDIFEGKKTYLTILALERGNESQKARIQQTLDAENPSEEEVEEVLRLMNDLKVFDDVASTINQHYDEAVSLIEAFPESDYKKELKNLLIFLKNRDH